MNTKQQIDNVDYERWQVAQNWEREHWLRNNKALGKYGKNYIWRMLALFGMVEKYRGDDRNGWWRQAFDGYHMLPADVDNALEVGCGPYTNMRLISQVCQPKHLFLSDPLIRTYVQFKMTFVKEMYRKAACYLDDHPIEELPFANDYFGLIVMINVLDHVRDARLCMTNLIRILRPGGLFVIGQDLTNEEDLAKQPDGLEVGHPVTLDEKWFAPYIGTKFETVFSKIVPREKGWAPQWHYGTLAYIGRKRE